MIVRRWRGTAHAKDAADYEHHFRARVLPQLVALHGFVRGILLRSQERDVVSFEVMTFWHTLDDVRNFAGPDYRRAVVEPDARAVLASYDEHADHFEIACDSEAGRP